MNNLLSRIGIGAAEVDTVLPKMSFKPGEELTAEVQIRGGETEQHVEAIYFAVLTRYKYDEGWRTGVIDEFQVLEPMTIRPDTDETHEVTFELPYNTPLTKGGDKVWLKTGLDVQWSVDPKDNDPLDIQPNERMENLFSALESLGFVFQNAQCERAPHYMSGAFVQELNYRPRSGRYRSKLDEVDVLLDGSEEQIDVYLEIESRPQGVGGMYDEVVDLTETMERFSFQDETAEELEGTLKELFDRNA